MEEWTDAELVRRIADREADASAAERVLCARYAPRIRLYGLRHLRDEARAADLVQIVLVAVLEAVRAGRVDEPDKLDRFVLGTCRNQALREHAAAARAEPVDPSELVAIEAPAREPVDLGGLVRCLGQLEERSRRVVLLTFHEEEPAEAIAVALSTTVGNVRVLRHRAIAALRRCLEAWEGAR